MSLIRNAFSRLHYLVDVIAQCVRGYLAYSLSLRNQEEMMAERGILVDHSTLHRWVILLVPLLDKAFRLGMGPWKNVAWYSLKHSDRNQHLTLSSNFRKLTVQGQKMIQKTPRRSAHGPTFPTLTDCGHWPCCRFLSTTFTWPGCQAVSLGLTSSS